MLNDKRILAIIPARGGSKGVPKKNIRLLNEKPLIGWTIEAAQKSAYIDKLILSTDCEEIAEVARQFNLEVPFLRPNHLAQDDTPGIEAILHVVSLLPGFDYIVMLQPTSPLRTTDDIDECIKKCIKEKHKSCVTVVCTEKTPYWMYQMDTSTKLLPFLCDKSIFRRQDAPITYMLNGAVYIAEKQFLESEKSYLTNETCGYEMPHNRSFDIDTEFDFKLVEWILNSK